jgi:hypothetical protein
MTIAPIPTRWNGVLYRSRTEARWAVFFDALGVEATYEPETFNLGGSWYLPDFFILQWNLYVEVKPREATEFERSRCERLAALTGRPVFMALGSPGERSGSLFLSTGPLKGNFSFEQCKRCLMLAISCEDKAAIVLSAPSGHSRCGGGIEPGGSAVYFAASTAANERFGVYPEGSAA